MAAFTWNQSAKTADDWNTYKDYLQKRIDTLSASPTVAAQSKALTHQTNYITAQKQFGSSEIQRQSIAILEGGATLQQKYDAVASSYDRAVSIGDESLAQTLRLQADSISQQMQYQAQAQQTLAGQMASQKAASIADSIRNFQDAADSWGALLSHGGENALNGSLKDLEKPIRESLAANGTPLPDGQQVSIWDVYLGYVNQIKQTYVLAAQATNDPIEKQRYIQQANDVVNNKSKVIDIPGLGGQTMQDIITARDSAAAGNPLIATKVDVNGNTVFSHENISGIAWAKSPDGQFYVINQTTAFTPNTDSGIYRKDKNGNLVNSSNKVVAKYDKNGNLVDAQGHAFTDKGALNGALKSAQLDYADLAKNAGLNIEQNGGQFNIGGTNQTDWFNPLGADSGQPLSFVNMGNGELRSHTTTRDANGNTIDHIYSLVFDANGQPMFTEINPHNTLDTTNVNAFGADAKALMDTIGQKDFNLPNRVQQALNPQGFVPFAQSQNVSDLIQSANNVASHIQQATSPFSPHVLGESTSKLSVQPLPQSQPLSVTPAPQLLSPLKVQSIPTPAPLSVQPIQQPANPLQVTNSPAPQPLKVTGGSGATANPQPTSGGLQGGLSVLQGSTGSTGLRVQ
jgi:hypothetical protein